MAELTLARESVEKKVDYNVLARKFENETRQTRLVTPDELMEWKIKTPNLTKSQAQAYLSHFAANFGDLTSFTFTCPVDDTLYNVAYKKGSMRVLYQKGYFKAEFEIERVFE